MFGPLDLRHAVRPPTLLVRLRDRDAAGQPDDDVVVESAALLELCYPYLVEGMAPPFQPLANVLEEQRDVSRLEALDVAIRERDHRGLVPLRTQRKLMKPCGLPDSAAEAFFRLATGPTSNSSSRAGDVSLVCSETSPGACGAGSAPRGCATGAADARTASI